MNNPFAALRGRRTQAVAQETLTGSGTIAQTATDIASLRAEVLQASGISKTQRKALAKKGHALADGSYPIPNVRYLKKAIQAYGRSKDKPAAKALIIKRAKALGRTDLLPEHWDESTKGESDGDVAQEAGSMTGGEASQTTPKVGEKNPETGEDDDEPVEQQLTGDILQADAKLGLVTCVVQRADVPVIPASPKDVELHYPADTIRQMCNSFLENGLQGEVGHAHEEIADGKAVKQNGKYGTVVQNWQLTDEIIDVITQGKIAAGDWIQTHHITDADLLQGICSGELRSPSLSATQGRYTLTPIEE